MALSLDGTTGISATGNIISSGGIISATGNIYGGNIIGTIAPSAITVSGNATVGNLLTAGFVSATGTVTGSSHLGAVVSVTANVTGGNILTAGIVSATGNISAPFFVGNGAALTGLSASKIYNGTSEANIGTSGGNANISIGGTSNVFVVATTGIYTTGLSSVTGNITAGNLTVSTGNIGAGNINNNNANGVGNIGSSTVYFNTVFGKATTAQYADLAELYSADAEYTPGTVLDFGGAQEVTLSTQTASNRIAGVVSTNPAHLMNSTLESQHTVAVALTGRVPTSVTGTVRKGDMMVSAGNGSAQASVTPAMGTVIGKALEDFDGASGVIEIVVGRL